ncbi:TonB family protein [Acidobacteriota bacterium]
MKLGKVNLHHAVAISVIIHSVLFMAVDQEWVSMPVISAPEKPPEPMRFTLVETEPTVEPDPEPTKVLSDADRVASSPDPGMNAPEESGTGSRVDFASKALPGPHLPPQPPMPESAPSREQMEAPKPEESPEPESDTEPLVTQDTESVARKRMALLESVFREKPPVEVIQQGMPPGPPAKGQNSNRFGPVQFDTTEFDFGPYARRIIEIVRKNWYAIMPWSARWGAKGKVRLHFYIHRDGTITDLEIVSSADSIPLDRAAMGSVNLSNPFPQLPEKFQEDKVGVTFAYYYNIPVEGD